MPVVIVTLPALASSAKPWNVKLVLALLTFVFAPKMTLPVCAVKIFVLAALPLKVMTALGVKIILL